MPRGIIILGPAGAGKTTLGRLVAGRLGFVFLDIDDYIWRWDTEIPYTEMYPQDEKIRRLMAAVVKARRFVMAGSMNSFHTHFDSMFELAVYLTATAEIRVKRLHSRELDEFGERILPGGDMYRAHRSFLEDAARYEQGAASCSSERHAAWLQALSCPILRLDGADDAQHNANRVVENYRKLQNHSG